LVTDYKSVNYYILQLIH